MSLALADKDHLVMETVSDVTVEMAKGPGDRNAEAARPGHQRGGV